MEIKIDLNNTTNKKDILEILGEALGYKSESFWGRNWDAFKDILGYVDIGGINGTNKIIADPLTVIFANFHEFKNQMPKDFNILESILNDNKKENPNFDYTFIE